MALDQEFDLEELQRKTQSGEGGEMSFLEHLEELRWHLVRSIAVILGFSILAFVFNQILFDVILFGPKRTDFWTYRALCDLGQFIYEDDRLCITEFGFRITNITMAGQFTSHLMISLVAGLAMGFPYVLFELWRFVSPALSKSERKNSRGLVFYGSVLFALGIAFGYFILSPVSVNFMGSYRVSDEVENFINLQSYLTFVATLSVGSGILFQLPMVVYFLARIGLVTSDLMKKYRRYALLIILILSAIITPPDVASQILLTVPIFGLYQLGIRIARRVERNKAAEL